jgi:hypothetical protein
MLVEPREKDVFQESVRAATILVNKDGTLSYDDGKRQIPLYIMAETACGEPVQDAFPLSDDENWEPAIYGKGGKKGEVREVNIAVSPASSALSKALRVWVRDKQSVLDELKETGDPKYQNLKLSQRQKEFEGKPQLVLIGEVQDEAHGDEDHEHEEPPHYLLYFYHGAPDDKFVQANIELLKEFAAQPHVNSPCC